MPLLNEFVTVFKDILATLEIPLPGGEMVNWKAKPVPANTAANGNTVKTPAATAEEVEFPPYLLSYLEKQKGADAAEAFMKEWRALSREERIEYLRSIGHAPKNQ